jgi:excisionase family DNA binding protein
MANLQDDGALSPRDFAQLYGIGLTKVYDIIKQGELRIVKLGRRTLIARSEARRWFSTLQAAA